MTATKQAQSLISLSQILILPFILGFIQIYAGMVQEDVGKCSGTVVHPL